MFSDASLSAPGEARFAWEFLATFGSEVRSARWLGPSRFGHPGKVVLRQTPSRSGVVHFALDVLETMHSEMPRAIWSGPFRLSRPDDSTLRDAAHEVVWPISHETSEPMGSQI